MNSSELKTWCATPKKNSGIVQIYRMQDVRYLDLKTMLGKINRFSVEKRGQIYIYIVEEQYFSGGLSSGTRGDGSISKS